MPRKHLLLTCGLRILLEWLGVASQNSNLLNTFSCSLRAAKTLLKKVKIKISTQNLHMFLDFKGLRVFNQNERLDKTDHCNVVSYYKKKGLYFALDFFEIYS